MGFNNPENPVRTSRLLVLPLVLAAAGCPEKLPVVNSTPAPTTSPTVPAEASIRPVYALDGEQVPAGTGFVVLDAGGKPWFLTACHVMDDEAEWRRAPMRFVDNDRWSGSFPLDRNTRYVFTIEGWRDPFASWRHEIEAKRAARVDAKRP